MVVCWRYGKRFDGNGCVSTLVNVDGIKWMYCCVNEFEVGVNDSIFSDDEQEKVYFTGRPFHGKVPVCKITSPDEVSPCFRKI